MLYASTRSSLTKSLGSTVFTDSLFATSKADLTPEAYEAYKRQQAAPKPLSAREQELADIKAAEREAGNSYEGSSARKNHIGQRVGLSWSSEAEDAVKGLGSRDDNRIVILVRIPIDNIERIVHASLQKIEPSTETLELDSFADIAVDNLSSSIPSGEPCTRSLYCSYAALIYSFTSIRVLCVVKLVFSGRWRHRSVLFHVLARSILTCLSSLHILLPYDITCPTQDDLLISGYVNLSRCEGFLGGNWFNIPPCNKEDRNVGPDGTQ